MENIKTRTRWTIEEMMCLYTLIEEKNGKGLELFLESHPRRTREAARKRYNLIKAGKIKVNEYITIPDHPEEILFDIEDYKPFRPNVFVRFWRFIKRIFSHNE